MDALRQPAVEEAEFTVKPLDLTHKRIAEFSHHSHLQHFSLQQQQPAVGMQLETKASVGRDGRTDDSRCEITVMLMRLQSTVQLIESKHIMLTGLYCRATVVGSVCRGKRNRAYYWLQVAPNSGVTRVGVTRGVVV